jgi:hypothetical protein
VKRTLLTLSLFLPLIGAVAAITVEPFSAAAMELPEICVVEAPMTPAIVEPQEETTCATDTCIDTYDHADGRESSMLPIPPLPLVALPGAEGCHHLLSEKTQKQVTGPPLTPAFILASVVRRE